MPTLSMSALEGKADPTVGSVQKGSRRYSSLTLRRLFKLAGEFLFSCHPPAAFASGSGWTWRRSGCLLAVQERDRSQILRGRRYFTGLLLQRKRVWWRRKDRLTSVPSTPNARLQFRACGGARARLWGSDQEVDGGNPRSPSYRAP